MVHPRARFITKLKYEAVLRALNVTTFSHVIEH